MLFKRFMFLTCIIATLGILMATLIQSTHPAHSSRTAFTKGNMGCKANFQHCSRNALSIIFTSHTS